MGTALLLLVGALGLVLLTVGADHLVRGAGQLATRLRVAPVVIGVVVIGLGTSMPEFLVSGVAATRGNGGLALGNLIGSNIINVTLILGAAALIAPVAVRSSVPGREAPLAVAGVAVFGGLSLWGLGLPAGAVLALLAAGATVVLVRVARVPPDDPLAGEVTAAVGTPVGAGWPREVVRAALGLLATLGGAQVVVSCAGLLAHRWGVPDTVIGVTLVAFGTSLPELVTSIQAQRHGEADLLVGNLLGSNLFNSLVGGAIVGFASRTPAHGIGYPLVAAMVGVNALAWLLLFRGYRVNRLEGGVLIGAYLATLPLLA